MYVFLEIVKTNTRPFVYFGTVNYFGFILRNFIVCQNNVSLEKWFKESKVQRSFLSQKSDL